MDLQQKREHLANQIQYVCSISAVTTFLCMTVFSELMKRMGFPSFLRTGVIFLLCYLPILLLFLNRPNQFPYDGLLVIGFAIGFFYLTLWIHPEYTNTISNAFWQSVMHFSNGVIGYFYIRLLPNHQAIKKVLLITSVILFIYYGAKGVEALRLGYWLLSDNGELVKSTYSMSYGYNMLRPTLVFFYYGIQGKKVLPIFVGVVGAVSILMLGSRAAAFCAVAFVVMYVLFFTMKQNKNNSKILLIVMLLLFAVLWMIFYRPILQGVANVFESLGFPSRTIERLLEGTVTDDAARSFIYEDSEYLVSSSGVFGHGMMGDRHYLGTYCHNIFLELLIQFGWVLGTALSVGLLVFLYKMLFKCKDEQFRGVFLILFCSCFFRLLVSYSFWNDTNFWMMTGLSVSYWRMMKHSSLEVPNEKKRS